MQKTIRILLIFILCLIQFNIFCPMAQAKPAPKNVLYLNSYHPGYKWSDDVLDGLKAGLAAQDTEINMEIEFMDTQRVSDADYIKKLHDVYLYKFKGRHFDLIISSDDAAFKFLQDYGQEIFPNTNVVFCGVNYFEKSMLNGNENFTGVVEGYDIESTLNLILQLHPQTQNIYYINDNSITGNAIMKVFLNTIPKFTKKLKFIRIDGNVNEIEKQVEQLKDGSVILYLIYFQDHDKNYYAYNDVISRIEHKSKVPIYGSYDQYLGYGIVGGKLTSGYYQGKTAAGMAIRILNGEKPSDIPPVLEETSQYEFDNLQLNKFGINVESLPPDSIIINPVRELHKQILILNSYNKGMQWTDDIETGIKSALKEKLKDIEFTYEYMDVKKNSSPTYIQQTYEYLQEKYNNKKYDLIITTDDEAFRFISRYHDTISKGTPVVFCGVNYLDDNIKINQKIFTGVIEAYDLKNTIDIALKLHRDANKIIVINDNTLTGIANRKNLNKLIPAYEGRVTFEFWDVLNMAEIQERVPKLSHKNIILLLSFNRDKSFNSFSYDDSIKLISENAKVPIYSVWDFYLGKGLLGGMLTSGFVQGETAGKLATQILNGTSPEKLGIIKECPNMYMFDYNIMKKFGINEAELPIHSKVINKPSSLRSFYLENRSIINVFLIIIIVLLILSLIIIVFLLYKNNKVRKASEENQKVFAMTDAMTGIPNRRAAFEALGRFVESANQDGIELTVSFLDINDLKKINDNFGHREGDASIKIICELVNKNIRQDDMLCRLGGDEFLLILPGTAIHTAFEIGKRIKSEIESFNNSGSKPYPITVSIGFGQYDREICKTVDELIEAADNEMYKDKAFFKENIKVIKYSEDQ